MKLYIRTRTAILLATTGALLVTLAATAQPASSHTVGHTIDHDQARLSSPAGSVWASTYEFLSSGTVQISLRAITERAGVHQGCVSSRVTFVYADGGLGMQDSPRVCAKGAPYSTDVETMFRSSATRDLVRYAVQLLSSSGPTTTPRVDTSSPYFIGDAPDSLGTSTRLDRDTLEGPLGDGSSIRATGDFAITTISTSSGTARNVTGQVAGEYAWPSYQGAGPSSRNVAVVWYYADGTHSVTELGQIHAGMAPRKMLATSDPRRDLESFDVGLPGSGWGWPQLHHFGDYED